MRRGILSVWRVATILSLVLTVSPGATTASSPADKAEGTNIRIDPRWDERLCLDLPYGSAPEDPARWPRIRVNSTSEAPHTDPARQSPTAKPYELYSIAPMSANHTDTGMAQMEALGADQPEAVASGGCVSGYRLIKMPAEWLAQMNRRAQDVATLGVLDGVAVTLACDDGVGSVGPASPPTISARQTRSMVLPHFDPVTQQWREARYVWYEENQAGYVLEHLIVFDLQTASVLATNIIMVESGEAESPLIISQVDFIRDEVSGDQVITGQDALQAVLRRWAIPGVTTLVRLRFLDDRPVWHVERSEEQESFTYLVDGRTGEPLGRYPLPSDVACTFESRPVEATEASMTSSAYSAPSSPLDPGGPSFIVGVDDAASWRDLSALSVVPAAARVNDGKPGILLRSLQSGQDPAVGHFLNLYNPSQIHYVGTSDPGAITGSDEVELAANVADTFWTSSYTATLTINTDYTSTIMAAQLAARLDTPLLFVTDSGVPTWTENVLTHLNTSAAVIVGSPSSEVLAQLQSLDIDATILGDARAVAAQTAALGTVDYVAITNPLDRDYDGWVRRLSLLAPALAAGHQGIVYPASCEVDWKITHPVAQTTTAKPSGAWQGSDDLVCYDFTADAPPRDSGATWQVYPVQGNYAQTSTDWLAGDYWEKRVVYLAGSSSSATAFDRALIDVDADGLFSDDEVFAAGGTFTVNDRLYRVYELGGDGAWGGELDHVVLWFETWKLGTAQVRGTSYPFAVTCGKASGWFGAFDVASIDLNHDGDFGDEDEGPLWPGDGVVLSSRQYVVTPGHDGSLRLTHPDARELACGIWQQLKTTGVAPNYVALVGFYDAIPFGVYRDVIMDDQNDVSSDMPYGDHDADPFLDASVGRLFGSNVFKAAALIARSIAYADLDGAWREQGLTLSNWSLDFPGAETTAKNVQRQLENTGVTVSGLYEADYADNWDVSLLMDKAFVAHFDHGTPMNPSSMRTVNIEPAVGTFWGCGSAWIEADPESMNAAAFLDQGGAGYIGNTRAGIAPISEHAFSLFWNRVINDRVTFGQAHRASTNFKVLDWLQSNDFADLSVAYRLVYYGDPALMSSPLDSPAVTPAHTTSTGSEVGDTVSYHGPGIWWTDTAHDDYGTTYYSRNGPGIVSTGWFATRFVFEQPVHDSVERVAQMTQASPPLGWTGSYFFDEGNARRASWMVVPLDYDNSNGQIRDSAPLLEYVFLSTPFVVVSDGTWKHSETLVTGWQELSFDDSAWDYVDSPTAGPCPIEWGQIPESPAEPIWSPNAVPTIYVRKTFTADNIVSGVIKTHIDDDFDLYVNGTLVRSDWDGQYTQIFEDDVTALLQEGENVIAIKAADHGGCRYVTVELAIEETGCPGGWDVSNVRLNGGGTNITVNPGDSVRLQYDYQVWNNSDYPSVIRQVLAGLLKDSWSQVINDCAYSGIPAACPEMTNGFFDHTFDAPMEPGEALPRIVGKSNPRRRKQHGAEPPC